MTAVRNDFLTEDHGPRPARPAAPRLAPPTVDDANTRSACVPAASATEAPAPRPARPAAPRLAAPTVDDANPWAVGVAAATAQRVQTATWIEDILADIDNRP